MRAWRCAYMPFLVTGPFFRECPWRTRSKRLLIASKGEMMCNFCKMGVDTCLLWLFLASAPGGLAPSDFSLSPETGVRRVFFQNGCPDCPRVTLPAETERLGFCSSGAASLGSASGQGAFKVFFSDTRMGIICVSSYRGSKWAPRACACLQRACPHRYGTLDLRNRNPDQPRHRFFGTVSRSETS